MIKDVKNPPKRVTNWIKRLRKCMKSAPKDIWFFSDGELYIMATGEEGEQMYTKSGGVDPDYIIDQLSDNLYEGGAW